jgi:hypothetical protein
MQKLTWADLEAFYLKTLAFSSVSWRTYRNCRLKRSQENWAKECIACIRRKAIGYYKVDMSKENTQENEFWTSVMHKDIRLQRHKFWKIFCFSSLLNLPSLPSTLESLETTQEPVKLKEKPVTCQASVSHTSLKQAKPGGIKFVILSMAFEKTS